MAVRMPRKTSFEFKQEELVATTASGRQTIRYYLAVLEGERLTQYLKAIDDIKMSSTWWKDCSAAQRQEIDTLCKHLREDLEENVRQRQLASSAVSVNRKRKEAA